LDGKPEEIKLSIEDEKIKAAFWAAF
jgi:hypothetical protein